MNKRIIGFLLALCVCAGLGGCASLPKDAEKGLLKQMTGGKIDVSGDSVTIQGEDGSTVKIGSGEWPDNELAKAIPELKSGKIVSAVETEDVVTIALEGVEAKAFDAYLEKLRQAFSKDVFEMEQDDGFQYAGNNDAGIGVSISYTRETGEVVVSVGKSDQ